MHDIPMIYSKWMIYRNIITWYMNDILLQSSLFFQNHIMNLPFFVWVFQQKRWAKHRQPTRFNLDDSQPREIPGSPASQPDSTCGFVRFTTCRISPEKKTNPKNHWTLLEGFDSVFRRDLFDLQTTSLEIPWYSREAMEWDATQKFMWYKMMGPQSFFWREICKKSGSTSELYWTSWVVVTKGKHKFSDLWSLESPLNFRYRKK